MKYTGSLAFSKPLPEATQALLKGLTSTKRMKRDLSERAGLYGQEGEFYIPPYGNDDFPSMVMDLSIIDGEKPPGLQPSQYCDWALEGNELTWKPQQNGVFPLLWLDYLIHAIIRPSNHILSGIAAWSNICYVNDVPTLKSLTILVRNNGIYVEKNDFI